MQGKVTGIHHVTALSSNAQRNVELYAGVLGMRLVKRTVNFDAPDVHHLYYGDKDATPGTILTFFPYQGLSRGRKGKGQATVTMFSIGAGSLEYWAERLARFNIEFSGPRERFGIERYISLEDDDGLCLELIADRSDARKGNDNGPVPQEHSIKGFFGITLSESDHDRTARLLTEQMDHEFVKELDGRRRYRSRHGDHGFVDIVVHPHDLRGLSGSGTVHHVAFATPDDGSQHDLQERLVGAGLQVTQVMDRQYFHSIYFREPGGVLFEIATATPGFMVDEASHELGSSLRLPPWMEAHRARIEAGLTPIEFEITKFQDRNALI